MENSKNQKVILLNNTSPNVSVLLSNITFFINCSFLYLYLLFYYRFRCQFSYHGTKRRRGLAMRKLSACLSVCKIADFRSLFARSASAVTHSEKSLINTNRKSTTRFPMSPRWTSYVVPKHPKGWLKKRKVSKIWTKSCDNSETVRDIMSVNIDQ